MSVHSRAGLSAGTRRRTNGLHRVRQDMSPPLHSRNGRGTRLPGIRATDQISTPFLHETPLLTRTAKCTLLDMVCTGGLTSPITAGNIKHSRTLIPPSTLHPLSRSHGTCNNGLRKTRLNLLWTRKMGLPNFCPSSTLQIMMSR